MAENTTTVEAPPALATNELATREIPAPRTDLDFERYRQLLLDQKALIQETLATLDDVDADGMNTTGSDRAELTSADQNHPGDLGTELQMREQDMALSENEREMLHRIERALQKIEEGTYGLSDRSFEPIPKERLEALPWATVTVEEQALEELAG